MNCSPRLTLLLALSCGCGDALPPGGGGDPTDYFPIGVGARWEYDNLGGAAGPETLVKEITGCEEIAFVDCVSGQDRVHVTAVQETTGTGAADDAGILYLETNDLGIVRIKQDIVRMGVLDQYITYSPYFVRLFNPPYVADREETFEHDRCEYEPGGVIRNQTVRTYSHLIVGEEEVTVPAGTYTAVVIQREDISDGDTKRYFWAEGVGKVLEQEILTDGTIGETEELTSYTAGGEACN